MRIALLAPIRNSLYARTLAYRIEKQPGLKLVSVIYRKALTWDRIQAEFRRDRGRLLRKVYKKLVLGDTRFEGSSRDTIGGLAAELGVPPVNLRALCRAINVPCIPVYAFDDDRVCDFLEQAAPDVIAFTGGGIIRSPILELAPQGVLNCHMGLLPEYRGMDVVEWPYLQEPEITPTGITVHRMDQGIDTGPVLLVHRMPSRSGESFTGLRERMEREMVEVMVQVLCGLRDGALITKASQSLQGRQYFVLHSRLYAEAASRLAAGRIGVQTRPTAGLMGDSTDFDDRHT